MSSTVYTVITAFIDKKAMLGKVKWRNQHPYHFLMEVLIEKYVQFLERKNSIGDLMPEGRKGKKDQFLQEAFEEVRNKGSYYVTSSRIQAAIPSENLKFRYKNENIAGLQLCDLLAHPSHMYIRELQGHILEPGSFCKEIQKILITEKYDRSFKEGKLIGYGVKWLP